MPHVKLFHMKMFCTLTLILFEVCAQCPEWLFFIIILICYYYHYLFGYVSHVRVLPLIGPVAVVATHK